jgi:hypothetical protein
MSDIYSKFLADIVATISSKDEVHGSWTEEVGFVIARELGTLIESGNIDHFYIKRDGNYSKYRIVKISENSED